MDERYTIAVARPRDVPALPAIESAAAALLEGHAPRSVLDGDATDERTFREAQEAGLLWVALADDTPVGFAHVEMLTPRAPHLEEIDVDPRHGRRGLGTALVRAVCEWVARRGYPDITLTTFRAVRWNMPFYAGLGFEELPAELWSPELAAVVRDEAARGLDSSTRVVMRYRPRATGLPQITGGTKMLGLIADPVVQARSPGMATALLRQWGQLGAFVLLPMEVPAPALAAVVTGLRQIRNFAGAIVSMPHKTAIVPLLDELTPEARLVGAVNVVRRAADGRLIGTVLDGEGFVAGLRSAGHEVAGASGLLIGAGGAAAAIAFALAAHGCASLTIANRTGSKAASLAARVREAFPAVRVEAGDAHAGRYDLAVNATSLGMRPDDALPIAPAVVERTALVAECVIAPEMTRLLEVAREKGRAIHTGVPMLAGQMELMLRFMGVVPPWLADLDDFVARFVACTIPHAEWTHAAHLAVGAWHVHRYGADEALVRLRTGIRRLNDSHGTPNSPASGYHETVTRAYVRLLAELVAGWAAGTSLEQHVEGLLAGPLADRGVLLRFYAPATLMSERARAEWVEPDVALLELAAVVA